MLFLRSTTLTMLFATTLVLSGCNKAIATDAEASADLETSTRADCLAKSNKDEKLLCLNRLAKQNESELANLDDKIESGDARNDKLRQKNEAVLDKFEEEVLESSKPN